MNPLDTPPADPSLRDRLEGMSAVQGLLTGAALAVPGWAIVFSAVAAVHALASALHQ